MKEVEVSIEKALKEIYISIGILEGEPGAMKMLGSLHYSKAYLEAVDKLLKQGKRE